MTKDFTSWANWNSQGYTVNRSQLPITTCIAYPKTKGCNAIIIGIK